MSKDYIDVLSNEILEAQKQIDQLKQQLAEKENRIAELENENGYILFEDGYDENGKEVHKQIYTTYKQAFKELVLATHKVRRQLKEKDKEIETLKQELEEINAGYDFTYEQSSGAIKELKQTQLAIQELAEIEILLYESHYKEIDGKYYAEYEDIKNLIDSRIKALEKEDA